MSQDDLPLVGLITIWYRAAEEMDRFLSDLKTLQYTRLRSVFVIHGQTSGEVERLRSTVPQAVILQPGRNLGCAAGWNLGISGLLDDGVDYIGMWNADVGVDPRYLERLVAIMQNDSTIGACQPLLFYSDEPTKVQMYGGSVNPSTGAGRHDYNGSTALTALPPWRDAQYLDGGTMLIRASVLRQVGGFSEPFLFCSQACRSQSQVGIGRPNAQSDSASAALLLSPAPQSDIGRGVCGWHGVRYGGIDGEAGVGGIRILNIARVFPNSAAYESAARELRSSSTVAAAAMLLRSRFLRNWSFLALSGIVCQLLGMLATVRIARALTPDGYCQYNLVQTLAAHFGYSSRAGASCSRGRYSDL